MKKYYLISIIILGALFIFFPLVFRGTIILPQFFHIGIITIHYYGLIMALAVLAGYWLAIQRASRYGIEQKTADEIIFWSVVGGFVGARLYHVLSSLTFYIQNPIDIFKVWNGGLSIYGAVIGGSLALFCCFKVFNLKSSILKLLDWLTPSLILGQIIGRFGNFFNYELYGYPTNLPWKMFVPLNFRPYAYMKFSFFHPLFLYEAVGNLIILIFLLKFIEPRFQKSRPGLIGFFGILLYNSMRFFLEFLRVDSVFVGKFRQNAIVSLLLVVFSAIYLLTRQKKC